MKSLQLLFTLLITVYGISCSNDRSARDGILSVAEKYVSDQLLKPERKILDDGTIMIGDTGKRYFIQPSKVFLGPIDNDDKTDGIVSVTSMVKSGGALNEHLIILNTDNKFLLIKSVESDMKILSLKNRIITAEVPTHPATNPLHNCPVCFEVVRFKFKEGELVRMN